MILLLILICQVDLVSTNCNNDTSDLGEAINSFGLDLYKLLPGNKYGNIFFSPFSISTALSMRYLGIAGKAAQEMKNLLRFNKCPDYHVLFKDLLSDIKRNSTEYTLKSANNLFPHVNIKLSDLYRKAVADFYLAEITPLDYSNGTYATKYINEWVSNNTEEKIKDIIPESLSPDVRLVLVNAIYFKGDWKYTFDKKDTKPMTFYSPGKKLKVDMMLQTLNETQTFVYFEDHSLNAQILELFYKGDDISMVIILPRTHGRQVTNLSNLEAVFNLSVLNRIQHNLDNHNFSKPQREVNVRIPKFLIDWKETKMKTILGRMCGCVLPVSDVIHQAFVEVNEEGTEAAAATVVIIAVSIGGGPVSFTADHPFLFLIRHRRSNTILFMGRVSKPNKAEKKVPCLTEEPCMKLFTGKPAPECCGCKFNFKDPSRKKSKPKSPMAVLRSLKKRGRDDCMEDCLNDKCLQKFGQK